MKRILAFLLLMFPFVSFANDIASMSADNVIAIFDETLPFIEERIKKINPDLVAKMANAENMDKIYEYKNFLVHHVFDEKVTKYVDMLYKHCESAGCNILHDPDKEWETWDVDHQTDPYDKDPKCYKDGIIGNERICPYPKDYDFSWLQKGEGHFEGFIDDLNTVHFYSINISDTNGSSWLSLFDTQMPHNTLLELDNQPIICNSQSYWQPYKECIEQDPEHKRCYDKDLTNRVIAKHRKCLEEHRPVNWDVKTNGGFVSVYKTW